MEAGAALVSHASSRDCPADFSAAGTNYFPGAPGKLLVAGQRAAETDLLQNAALFPSHLARGKAFTGSQI